MKKIVVEFKHLDGKIEEVTFETDRSIEWTIEQYSRNRAIVDSKVISETTINNKQMLFG
jgi:hypothetical protein